jgi:hypothetical protein
MSLAMSAQSATVVADLVRSMAPCRTKGVASPKQSFLGVTENNVQYNLLPSVVELVAWENIVRYKLKASPKDCAA